MNEKIKLLKALSDETRIKILRHLLDGEKCACSIVPSIGKAQPTVSQHLKSKEAKQIMKILGIKKIKSKMKC